MHNDTLATVSSSSYYCVYLLHFILKKKPNYNILYLYNIVFKNELTTHLITCDGAYIKSKNPTVRKPINNIVSKIVKKSAVHYNKFSKRNSSERNRSTTHKKKVFTIYYNIFLNFYKCIYVVQ